MALLSKSSILNKLLYKEKLDELRFAVENDAYLGEQLGGIPLLNAIRMKNHEAAELFLSFGADPNLYTEDVCIFLSCYSKKEYLRLILTGCTQVRNRSFLGTKRREQATCRTFIGGGN
mgnify:CR=1 FL=1